MRKAQKAIIITCLLLVSSMVSRTFSGCGRGGSVADSPQSKWIARHAKVIRSIDPNDTSFDDLEPLLGLIGNSTIVLLGEQSHGEGSTFSAKARLIKFLHEKAGFDVLAMESGLYSCEKAGDEILKGAAAREMVAASVFDVWTGSEQFQPVIQYLEQTRSSRHPLELTGFDMQMTGTLSRDALAGDLRPWLGSAGNFTALWEILAALSSSVAKFKKIPEDRRQEFYREADAADRVLGRCDNPQAIFMRQVLQSTKVNASFLWNADFEKPDPAVMNLRDEQMAKNLLWLARKRYNGRKIIVWAATSHISRNRQKIRQPIADPGMIPMGHHLWQVLHESIYVIGFTSARGRFGSWRSGPVDLAYPREGTLEYFFAQTQSDYLFLDFRSTIKPGDWLAETVTARPMGHALMAASWPEIMDAMVFIRTTEPSRSIDQ